MKGSYQSLSAQYLVDSRKNIPLMTELEDQVESEIDDLYSEMEELGATIANHIDGVVLEKDGWDLGGSPENRFSILMNYEVWYNRALPLVNDYLPDRASEFKSSYNEVRNCIVIDTRYITDEEISNSAELSNICLSGITFQQSLLKSIPARVASESLKAKNSVSRTMVNDELETSQSLLDDGNIRSAGVICGVAIERHLLTMCETAEEDLDFGYMDGITSLAQTLYDSSIIDGDDQRLLEYLAGIRNKCSHANDEEPEKAQVDRMLNQANEFIRTSS